jgi:hypothetical protein
MFLRLRVGGTLPPRWHLIAAVFAPVCDSIGVDEDGTRYGRVLEADWRAASASQFVRHLVWLSSNQEYNRVFARAAREHDSCWHRRSNLTVVTDQSRRSRRLSCSPPPSCQARAASRERRAAAEPGCGPGGRGFESHRSPSLNGLRRGLLAFWLTRIFPGSAPPQRAPSLPPAIASHCSRAAPTASRRPRFAGAPVDLGVKVTAAA